LDCDGDGLMGHTHEWVANHDDVPGPWVTRQYEVYPSLVDGVRGIGNEDPGGFRGLARGIVYFLVDLQPRLVM